MAAKKPEEVNEEEIKDPTLPMVMAQINRKYGKGTVGKLDDFTHLEEKLSTSIPQLDTDLGGGIPLGRIAQFYGLQSSGKSVLAQKLVANAQKQGLDAFWFDCEGTFDKEWAKKLGVDVDKLGVSQEAVAERVFEMIRKLLTAKPGIIVVDSVASMRSEKEFEEEDFGKDTIALMARFLSKGLPILNALNERTLILFINQLRTNITVMGAFGNTVPGGRALSFFSSIMIELKRDKDFITDDGKKKGEPIGQVVHYKIDKNKTAPPMKTGSFKLYYEDGRME
jgi:recombination protein RecA